MGAIILALSHGYAIDQDLEGKKLDPLVELADEGLRMFSSAAEPGKWAVDLLPFREYLFLRRWNTRISLTDIWYSALYPDVAI